MKTLAMNKIEERKTFILGRIRHRYEHYKKGLISYETFAEYKNKYIAHFNGYITALWDMELLTDEEHRQIFTCFMKLAEELVEIV